MTGMVIEWAPFTLAESATEARLLEASEALQEEFLKRQAGFVKRELLRGAGRQWCDLLYWDSSEAAQRAMDRVGDSPACSRYFQLMVAADQTGAGVQHFLVRQSYQGAAP